MSLNQLLRDKPMDFMRRFAVSPPSGAGYSVVPNPLGGMGTLAPNQSLTPKQTIWKDALGTAMPAATPMVGAMRVAKGGVVWVNVVDVPRDKPGAKTFDVSMTSQGDRVPVHFLPWDGMGSLVEMYLRDPGADLDDPDNPNIFFTAALSGCSVFVDGDPTRPHVVHAGIDGKLKVDAADFWRDRLIDLGRMKSVPLPLDDHLQEVNKDQYGDSSMWIRGYRNWLEASAGDTMTIRRVSGWACVFGIRFGRHWSFYVQRNATVSLTTLVKRSDVDRSTKTAPVLKGSATPVQATVQKKGLFGKKVVYSSTTDHARPVVIESFYPRGGAVIKIRDEYSAI